MGCIECMCYKQCQICHDSYRIQCTRLRQCPNTECNAFVCNHCMEIWLQENTSCPICHNTDIDPLCKKRQCYNQIAPNDIENQNVDQVISRRPIKCFCACNCQCKYNELPFLVKLIIYLGSIWLLGFTTYWMAVYLVSDNFDDFDHFTEYLSNPVFNIFMILWGFIVFIVIGGISLLCSCCRRLCLME